MNRKVCISCNNIITSKEDFEEYLDDSVNKILRNRVYSGLWNHKNCSAPLLAVKTKKKSELKDNTDCDIDYYQKLKIRSLIFLIITHVQQMRLIIIFVKNC